jgi:hypothetical protein
MDNRGRAETCIEVLERWDAGDTVWTVEMGGLGPGYEQAIQLLAMECLRELVRVDFKWTGDKLADSNRVRALLDPVVTRVDKWPGCGFSGAQVGGAMQIAAKYHHDGPIKALEGVEDERRIQVSKEWPHEPGSAPTGTPNE